jgi:hypothetical protein
MQIKASDPAVRGFQGQCMGLLTESKTVTATKKGNKYLSMKIGT